MQIALLLFKFKLYFLNIFLLTFNFKFRPFKLSLELSSLTSFILKIFCKLYILLILVQFLWVSVSPEVSILSHGILCAPLMLIQISPQLSYKFPISLIILLGLQGLIFNHHVVHFSFILFLQIMNFFFKFIFYGLNLSLKYILLPFSFVVVLAESFDFLLFLI